MLGAIDPDLSEVESVIGVVDADDQLGELVEHASVDPFISAGSQRGVRHDPAQESLGGFLRATGDQSDHDPVETHPIIDSGPVTAQRMRIDYFRQQGREPLP